MVEDELSFGFVPNLCLSVMFKEVENDLKSSVASETEFPEFLARSFQRQVESKFCNRTRAGSESIISQSQP